MNTAKKEYKFGLKNARSHYGDPKLVMSILYSTIALQFLLLCGLLGYLIFAPKLYTFPREVMAVYAGEVALSCVFIWRYARWELHGHLVTMWQVGVSLVAVTFRVSLYSDPLMFGIVMTLLPLVYWLGLMTELWGATEARVPPFLPKKVDKSRPTSGWLGKKASVLFKTQQSRTLVTAVLFAAYMTKTIGCLVFGSIKVKHDAVAIGDNLDLLFAMTTGFAFISILPNLIVDLLTLPEFITDFLAMKKASKGYRTDPFEVCEIDEDDLEDGELKQQMKNHKCCPITVVIPCYMPNEEEILDTVLDYYKEQSLKYPGVMKVLVVWNSPDDHPEVVRKFDERKKVWPNFDWERDRISTSKCDNLNTALDYITTEVALLNDADTMVAWGTFVRASMRITGGKPEDQVDVAQAHSTHCKNDFMGTPEGGNFCFGAVITMSDASKPKNMATQGLWKHAPFNGRGGFWRVSALKMCGFDHWSIGEDHDAMYRGIAYYGLKGILDPNMLCQEQEPPDCGSLTKQRIRWETAALEMRRTFNWALRSPHYTSMEAFTLIWSQLYANANLPLQYMPMQAFMIIPLGITKTFIWRHVFTEGCSMADQKANQCGHGFQDWKVMCKGEDCLAHFKVGQATFMIPYIFGIFLAVFAAVMIVWIFDCIIRATVTRYRPRPLWLFNAVFVSSCTLVPFLTYCQFFALRDYCFGGAKFIPTKRSPSTSQEKLTGSNNNLLSNENLVKMDDQAFNTSNITQGGLGKKSGAGGNLMQPLLA